ncbi:MAG: L-histidine N(alpha)-methyltransferase [Actinomycetota bacterium]|nr:L-histidine N(alpha)-methyltransferase [Actinomycetota bacterium]
MRADVRAGLTTTPKSLPPKWFYDDAGSELFEKITRLEEYYPTEAEREILLRHAGDIVELSAADHVVELGAGNSDKTRAVLDAFATAGRLHHISVLDVSGDFLERSAADLASTYPNSEVHAVVGDFEEHLGAIPTDGTRVVLFLGGTIGNLDPAQRKDFLGSIANMLQPGDAFLLGTDLIKNIDRLELAYDDPAGITAAFNLNILNVLNRELHADFDLDQFEHRSFFDVDNEWMDLGLISLVDQSVFIADLDLTVDFAAGEVMRTEISAKFTPGGIACELADAGLELRQFWTDQAGDFAVTLSVR